MAVESSARGITRIVDILDCFTPEEPVLSLTSLSNRVGLAKSTTHRLANSLVKAGLLLRDVDGRGYQLGYRMLYWGMVAQAALDLRHEALPVLSELSRDLNETVILSVRDGTSGVCLEIIESSHPVRLAMRPGQPLRLHAGASSKVLLAFLPEAEIAGLLKSIALNRLTQHTITDPALLAEELAAIRERGYATSYEETDPGAMGIAAPVYDHAGELVAGIGIAAPIPRILPERVSEVAARVVDAAAQLSARLGAKQPVRRNKR